MTETMNFAATEAGPHLHRSSRNLFGDTVKAETSVECARRLLRLEMMNLDSEQRKVDFGFKQLRVAHASDRVFAASDNYSEAVRLHESLNQ